MLGRVPEIPSEEGLAETYAWIEEQVRAKLDVVEDREAATMPYTRRCQEGQGAERTHREIEVAPPEDAEYEASDRLEGFPVNVKRRSSFWSRSFGFTADPAGERAYRSRERGDDVYVRLSELSATTTLL